MEDDLSTIVLVEDYPHPPAAVWRALTDRDLLARWLMPNDFVPRVGHEFSFKGVPMPVVGFSGTVRCKVLELIAERRLAISWADATAGTMEWTVSWTLEPAPAGGTRVTLVHNGFDPDSPTEQLSRRIMGGGWRPALQRLGAVATTVGEAT